MSGKLVEPVTVAERLAELAQQYGSLRKAEAALGFNRCYVSRVANGHQREALGPETLRKLGLRILYVREAPPRPQNGPQGPAEASAYVPRTAWAGGPPWGPE